ncbi:MAG TPA: hypothetical protein VD963_05390 [Phycisphaerales bacterium]|nr:hypothetical protein [Phycisphaerales bacterium]
MPDPRPAPRLGPRHALLVPVAVAMLVRLYLTGTIPLTMTTDSGDYLLWAAQLAAGQWPDFPGVRTPGYPLFLSAVVALAGQTPTAIVLAQHLLGVGVVALGALVTARVAGPLLALGVGLALALDPWMLTLECCALSEAPATFLSVLALAVVMLRWSRGLAGGLLLGAVLAAACLVRPAMQIAVPLVGAAALLDAWRHGARGAAGPALRARARAAAPVATGLALGLALLLGPWLVHNARRGIVGLANGTEMILFVGFERAGMLDEAFPLRPQTAAAYALFKQTPPTETSRFVFLRAVGLPDSPEAADEIARWCRHSVRSRTRHYLRTAAWVTLWQLNCFPSAGWNGYSETAWLMRGLGRADPPPNPDAPPNFFTDSRDPSMVPYQMWNDGGPPARLFGWLGRQRFRGIPQVPLCLLTLGVIGLALLRRRFDLALLFAVPVALIGVHVAMLLIYDRYGLPSWIMMYLAPAGLAALWRRAPAAAHDEASHARPALPLPGAPAPCPRAPTASGRTPGAPGEPR